MFGCIYITKLWASGQGAFLQQLLYNKVMIRKIFKTGHSAAVTLPQKMLADLGLKLGDAVKVEVDKEKQVIIVSHGKKEKQMPLGLKIRQKL